MMIMGTKHMGVQYRLAQWTEVIVKQSHRKEAGRKALAELLSEWPIAKVNTGPQNNSGRNTLHTCPILRKGNFTTGLGVSL